MGEAYFYHLTRQSTDQALVPLLDKCLQQGWRVLIRPPNDMRADWLDERLWMHPDDGFLPHGRAGGAHDAAQPILICPNTSLDGFDCLVVVEGANVNTVEVQQSARTCIVFDASDDAAMTAARQAWKAMTDAKCGAKYWSQAHGTWRMEREVTGDDTSGA